MEHLPYVNWATKTCTIGHYQEIKPSFPNLSQIGASQQTDQHLLAMGVLPGGDGFLNLSGQFVHIDYRRSSTTDPSCTMAKRWLESRWQISESLDNEVVRGLVADNDPGYPQIR
jgi:hypothetical protein